MPCVGSLLAVASCWSLMARLQEWFTEFRPAQSFAPIKSSVDVGPQQLKVFG